MEKGFQLKALFFLLNPYLCRMKKTLIVSLFSLISLSGYSQVIDTLGIGEFQNGTSTLYTSPNGGFAFGNNGYGDLAKAQTFRNEGTAILRKVLLKFGEVVYTSGDANSTVVVNVYNNYGPGIVVGTGVPQDSIAPDSILATMSIPVSQLLDDGTFAVADFSSENILLPQNFSVGVDFSQLMVGDTVGLNSTTDGDANGSNQAWELSADSVWFQVAESAYSWGLDVQLAMFPIVEVENPASITEQNISVSVYPNPCANFLNLTFMKSGNYEIQLNDATGRTVLLTTTQDREKTVDVSELNSGLYVLSVYNGSMRSVYSIIKE